MATRKENLPQEPEYILEKYGIDVRIGLALVAYLNALGDSSAASSVKVQEFPNMSPHFARLVVRYDLRDIQEGKSGAFGTEKESKGIMMEGFEFDEKDLPTVFYSGDVRNLARVPADIVRRGGLSDRARLSRSIQNGWIRLEDSPIYNRFKYDIDDLKVRQEESFGFKNTGLSTEDRTRLAMTFAYHRPDYRSGINTNTPIGPLGHIVPDSLFVAL